MIGDITVVIITDLLSSLYILLWQDPRIELAELKRVFEIQSTNGANLHVRGERGRGLGVYPIFALLNHSCM